MKQDHSAKLAKVEAAMSRWQSRLTRATNALNKLAKQRRRLLANKVIADMTAPPGEPTPIQKRLIEEAKAPKVDLELPAFLDRGKPAVAEEMTRARKAAEAAERSKMPLTGKAAMRYISEDDNRVRKSRIKRKLAEER